MFFFLREWEKFPSKLLIFHSPNDCCEISYVIFLIPYNEKSFLHIPKFVIEKFFLKYEKKIKKTQFELSIWVIKRQVHFFQKICARATRGKHFSGDKQKCGNEFFLMLLELELENKPLKCKKK